MYNLLFFFERMTTMSQYKSINELLNNGLINDVPSSDKSIWFYIYLQVKSILKSYRWAPFVPVAPDSSMLSVMLLLSKYRLRNVPVIETGNPSINNFITQSAVIHGLQGCKGRDWFDCISAHPLSELGLPFMSADQVSDYY